MTFSFPLTRTAGTALLLALVAWPGPAAALGGRGGFGGRVAPVGHAAVGPSFGRRAGPAGSGRIGGAFRPRPLAPRALVDRGFRRSGLADAALGGGFYGSYGYGVLEADAGPLVDGAPDAVPAQVSGCAPPVPVSPPGLPVVQYPAGAVFCGATR